MLSYLVAGEWRWQMLAACREADMNLFFESNHGDEEREAKRICDTCPVMELCRSHAVDVDEPYGIWGGLSPQERRIYRRQQKWFTSPLAS
ncbi:WhiB family transcriptional regulator [Rhodococcus opacus]|uniref:WhiB family transcriptional regulator n=1 Tax=Rhodococcus opacus TaxID=37919 RepID=UPI002949C0C5|nr:WhiB family transcriptional regulator [Rhodococcus opacus]MDV6247046.1 WhiB family transcriptional regulator [Rhodococcus opacus]